MSIEVLPTEVQCSIIRLLDPIGLVSISQTNTHFRRVVSPQRKHFAEKLLALESVVEYGGLTPIFRSRDNFLNPDCTDERWSSIRWACTGCLRLLPHHSFDNHSILRLGYRKPIPGSAAAGAVTTWEPVARASGPILRQQKFKSYDTLADEKKLRRRYLICVTSGMGSIYSLSTLQECGMVGFEGLSSGRFNRIAPADKLRMLDDNALAIERERCGNKRHFRKCNECRYLAGQLTRPDGYGGTPQVPIALSRKVVFGSHLDRYFPKFSDFLEAKQPSVNAPTFRIIKNTREQSWTMYMIRCPVCTRWQELREFRFGGTYHRWKPIVSARRKDMRREDQYITQSTIDKSFLNESSCNNCFAETYGRHELSRVLSHWIKELIDIQLDLLLWQMERGWRVLNLKSDEVPKEYYSELKNLLDTIPSLKSTLIYSANYDEVALMTLAQGRWKDVWKRMKLSGDTGWATKDMDIKWYDEWVSDSSDAETHWRWLMACKAELEEKSEVLADWALSRDGAAFY